MTKYAVRQNFLNSKLKASITKLNNIIENLQPLNKNVLAASVYLWNVYNSRFVDIMIRVYNRLRSWDQGSQQRFYKVRKDSALRANEATS
jgi:hypothetical protein